MAKIKTNTHKRLRPKKRLFDNKTIVIIKIVTACVLLLGCSLFFFSNLKLFGDDFSKFWIRPFPIIFFAGLIWICVYIVNLAGKIDSKDLHHADRFDWLYRLVFIITILSMIFRTFVFANLSMPWEIITLCAISGVATLCTPRIVDNNNDEF